MSYSHKSYYIKNLTYTSFLTYFILFFNIKKTFKEYGFCKSGRFKLYEKEKF